MSVVSEIITQDQIQDLWGCGFTILPRLRDPFELPKELIPRGQSYQWNETPTHLRPGTSNSDINVFADWIAVPYERHPGYFGPYGMTGPISFGGLWLQSKPTAEVEKAKVQQIADAQKPMQDWAERNKEFSGEVKVGGVGALVGEAAANVFKSSNTNSIDTTVAVPKDMFPHMSAIFAERDRLKDEIVLPDRMLLKGEIADKFYAAIEADKSLPWWPTLHAILLPIAIENVRKSLKQEIKS